MDVKDWISLSALVVSVGSAWAAIDARNAASELAQRQFQAEKTLEILASVYEEMSAAQGDALREKAVCYFVLTLAEAEASLRREPPYFVRQFVTDVTSAGLWPPACAVRGEAVIARAQGAAEAAPAATRIARANGGGGDMAGPEAGNGNEDGAGMRMESPVAGEETVMAMERPETMGAWQALIASYNVTRNGCRHAREDVAHFREALAGRGFDGRWLYVARTRISNHYAVTVDAGEDRALAGEISQAIRAAAPPDGTGRDSFVQGNRNWSIDPDCEVFARIGE